MAAYLIAQMEVHDPVKYAEYAAKVMQLSGAKLVVAADQADVLEGAPPYPRTVIGEFPDAATARGWYESEGYSAIKHLRQESSNGTVYIIEGFSVPPVTGAAQ